MVSAIPFVRRTARELVDGTLAVTIHVEPIWRRAFMDLFPDIDMHGAMAPLTQEAAQKALDPKHVEEPAPYGVQAQALYRSSFFRRPEVWRAVGTDKNFLNWLKTRPCAAVEDEAMCDGDVVPAHVRRVASGAGTARKPEYSAIPLCAAHHALQHTKGESALGGKEWFDRQRVEHLHAWCWAVLKSALGYAHWNEVPPGKLVVWACSQDVADYLPQEYAPGKYK